MAVSLPLPPSCQRASITPACFLPGCPEGHSNLSPHLNLVTLEKVERPAQQSSESAWHRPTLGRGSSAILWKSLSLRLQVLIHKARTGLGGGGHHAVHGTPGFGEGLQSFGCRCMGSSQEQAQGFFSKVTSGSCRGLTNRGWLSSWKLLPSPFSARDPHKLLQRTILSPQLCSFPSAAPLSGRLFRQEVTQRKARGGDIGSKRRAASCLAAGTGCEHLQGQPCPSQSPGAMEGVKLTQSQTSSSGAPPPGRKVKHICRKQCPAQAAMQRRCVTGLERGRPDRRDLLKRGLGRSGDFSIAWRNSEWASTATDSESSCSRVKGRARLEEPPLLYFCCNSSGSSPTPFAAVGEVGEPQ
ncbi:PREDICTED: uncharacterized protein LOC106148855 [Chinchilla lanigera]|uniref:uncharacterized protein LOC106148855 n=1 Tax=Chinchilla lanigera TaxID=34839 RepID=UPI000695EAB8|nr:PREDICTED: uncharacterized protein LOC106148855 [Chinchilla lanigera]